MEQFSDEEVMRFAPPEIRRLWRKLLQIEEGMADLRKQQQEVLRLLTPDAGMRQHGEER